MLLVGFIQNVPLKLVLEDELSSLVHQFELDSYRVLFEIGWDIYWREVEQYHCIFLKQWFVEKLSSHLNACLFLELFVKMKSTLDLVIV